MDMTQEQINTLYDADVISVDGDRLGPVQTVYVDDITGLPTWVTVRTGWFGRAEHPVPLEGAEWTECGIRVSASGDEVREAPTPRDGQHLNELDVDDLHRHYGLGAPPDDTGAVEDAHGPPEAP